MRVVQCGTADALLLFKPLTLEANIRSGIVTPCPILFFPCLSKKSLCPCKMEAENNSDSIDPTSAAATGAENTNDPS
jgi:hypothetical protein